VTPCVYMPIPVGDLRKKRFYYIWSNSELFHDFKGREDMSGHCMTCDFKYNCGGCRARAYAYFGDHQASDPGCKFNQDLWDAMHSHADLKPADGVHCNMVPIEDVPFLDPQ